MGENRMANHEKFNYAGYLDQEIKEIQKLYDGDEDAMDSSTVTESCMYFMTILCC